jgi:hypothetical protein
LLVPRDAAAAAVEGLGQHQDALLPALAHEVGPAALQAVADIKCLSAVFLSLSQLLAF